MLATTLDGVRATRVAIAHGRNIRFARLIQLGGRHLDQMIAGTRNCGMREAREYRLQFVTPMKHAAAEAVEGTEELPEGMAVLIGSVGGGLVGLISASK